MSELVIYKRDKIKKILRYIKPFLIIKRNQALLVEKVLSIMEKEKRQKRSWIQPKNLLKIVKLADDVRSLNSNRKNKSIHTLEKVKYELKKNNLIF